VLAARWMPARPSAAPLLAAAGAVAILLPCLPSLRHVPQLPDAWIEAARWLGTQPRVDGEEGVLGAWELGHLVRYYGGRPAVATPFGTEGGAGAMEAVARFDLGPGGEAEALLHARRARWVMMLDPVVRAYSEASLLGSSFGVRMERSCSAAEGKVDSVSAEFLATTGARLFYFDGGSAPEFPAPPLDALRLVYESPPSPVDAGAPSRQVKTFERVAGATVDVTGAGPGEPVRASVRVRTNQGRVFTWSTAARADTAGRARLRLPYATGRNGAVESSPCALSGRGREVALVLDARQVAQGERVWVDLGGEPQQGGADPARTRP
jgi:asparagine N-glycosylation enzyme membrane subunit Stt3